MLDDAERESLAETERQLARTDPHLDTLLRRGHARRRRVVTVAAWGAGVLGGLLVVCLLWLGLGGQAMIVTALTVLVLGRHLRRTDRWRGRRPGNPD